MSITFQYPYTSPTLTLVLRNPELGDSNQIDIKTQFKIAMDGTIRSHKRTPKNQKLLLTFTNLSKTDIENLFTFVTASSGNIIGYIDYESTLWKGIILTSPTEVLTQAEDSCSDKYTFTLEFQCVP